MKNRIVDQVFNEVYSYGGLPMRLGDIITDMDSKAKEMDKKNWFKIREAGLAGLMSSHHYKPLENIQPISLAQFYEITEFPRHNKGGGQWHRNTLLRRL